MTSREAAIVSAYTGFLIGDFAVMHAYIEELLGRPIFTHELGDKSMSELIKNHSKNDFISIEVN